jgi:hypothetical protein
VRLAYFNQSKAGIPAIKTLIYPERDFDSAQFCRVVCFKSIGCFLNFVNNIGNSHNFCNFGPPKIFIYIIDSFSKLCKNYTGDFYDHSSSG